jgi:hypothetical protein
MCTKERIVEGKEMLERIGQMLTRLVQMFEHAAVREERAEYNATVE